MFRPVYLLAALCLVLAGCAVGNPPPASPDVVARAAYRGGPAELTLFTVRNVESDAGEHTALLVNGSQQVLWDPAGSFQHPDVPEVGDVLFGFTPMMEKVYIDYHVRPDFYVVKQELSVSRETADAILAAVRGHGAAGQATCALSTSGILGRAGIGVGTTWFPNSLMDAFAKVPGVATQRIDQSNVDMNHNVVFGKNGVPLPRGA